MVTLERCDERAGRPDWTAVGDFDNLERAEVELGRRNAPGFYRARRDGRTLATLVSAGDRVSSIKMSEEL